jgi:alkanesulfonate monooxygenase SsuD/methylene tetrahydromethanopterin reductase-like flavin-dependent oxidoreductase (luciferase family)
MAERMVNLGVIIGTPDEAIDRIKKLQEVSGGFGCLLGLAHEWTTWEKTLQQLRVGRTLRDAAVPGQPVVDRSLR